MAAVSHSAVASSTWSRWQFALIVGAPIAIGIGYWYFRSSRLKTRHPKSVEKNKSCSVESNEETESLNTKKAEVDDPIQTQLDKAEDAKIEGNKLFKEGKFDEAIKRYTEAIETCPPEKTQNIATYYQNRAAAYEQLRNYTEVINDCGRALELNASYVKALSRRGKAYENVKEPQKALEDVTAVCILEHFENQSSLIMADRVLKQLGELKARDSLKAKKPLLPSSYFVKTYFASFTEDPVSKVECNGVAEETLLESPYLTARENLLAQKYDSIVEDCTKEIENADAKYRHEALLLRATFQMIQGLSEEAFRDLEELVKQESVSARVRVNGLIRLATLKVHHHNITEALADFDAAEAIDPNNADIYHHRGAIFLLCEKAAEAVSDFKKAIELSPNFALAAVQKCYADYRLAFVVRNLTALQEAMESFPKVLKAHPHCVEGYTLYAQALADQQEFNKADEFFDKALEIDPNSASIYVHKGLLQLQWKQDTQEAVRLIKLAIERDNKCAFAYEALGTIEVQRGDLDQAVELFDDAIALVRTEPELAHLFSLKEAAVAQRAVARRLGIEVPRFDL